MSIKDLNIWLHQSDEYLLLFLGLSSVAKLERFRAEFKLFLSAHVGEFNSIKHAIRAYLIWRQEVIKK